MGISKRNTTKRNKKAPKSGGDPFIDSVLAVPLTRRTLSHTTHRQKTGVYLQTWKRGII